MPRTFAVVAIAAILLNILNTTAQSVPSEAPSRLRPVIERYEQDRGAYNRFYSAETSAARRERFRKIYQDRLAELDRLNFASLEHHEQVDHILFANHLRRELAELDRNAALIEEMRPIIPFAAVISDLEDQRRRLETIDPEKTAATLDALARTIGETQKAFADGKVTKPKRTVANRAVRMIASLRSTLRNWYNFHNAYDPQFSWWNKKPYEAVEEALQKYSTFVVSQLVGIPPDDKT
jgi:hypothetical protein